MHEHAELYRAVAVPQPPVARVGNPVVAVLIVVVYVAQKAEAEESAAGEPVGNRARRQLRRRVSLQFFLKWHTLWNRLRQIPRGQYLLICIACRCSTGDEQTKSQAQFDWTGCEFHLASGVAFEKWLRHRVDLRNAAVYRMRGWNM